MLIDEVLLCDPKSTPHKGILITHDVAIENGSTAASQHSIKIEESSHTLNSRHLDPMLTQRTVRAAIENQPPKLLFSVCQALGSVGCVLLTSHLEEIVKKKEKEKNKEREWRSEEDNGEENRICRDEDDHNDDQGLQCIKRISTILIAMLRYGLVKVREMKHTYPRLCYFLLPPLPYVLRLFTDQFLFMTCFRIIAVFIIEIQYQAAKALVSLLSCFADHEDSQQKILMDTFPEDSGTRREREKGANNHSSKEYGSQEISMAICKTELLESVLVTAIAINNGSSCSSSCVLYPTAASPGVIVPLVKNIPGITRKTTTRTAKVTAAADRLASLQHSLLMLLHLLTHPLPATATMSTENIAAQVSAKCSIESKSDDYTLIFDALITINFDNKHFFQTLFYHADELTDWLQCMQWDESVLSSSDVMLELPSVTLTGNHILDDYPTPRSLVVCVSGNMMRIMEESDILGYVKNDPSRQPRNQTSTVDHTGSKISTTTLKKLKKLSILPQERENIDVLSATLPYLATTSCPESPLPNFNSDTAEMEEDEI